MIVDDEYWPDTPPPTQEEMSKAIQALGASIKTNFQPMIDALASLSANLAEVKEKVEHPAGIDKNKGPRPKRHFDRKGNKLQ